MSRTMVVHVRYKSWCISWQSYVKQHPEITNFALSAEREPDTFKNLYFEFYALFHIQFVDSLTNRNKLNVLKVARDS